MRADSAMNRQNRAEEHQSELEGKIANIKQNFISEYSSDNIQNMMHTIDSKVLSLNKQIEAEQEVLSQKIEELKIQKIGTPNFTKGEFEKTEDYNRRIADTKKQIENFEKYYAAEIEEIKTMYQPTVDAAIRSLSAEIELLTQKKNFLKWHWKERSHFGKRKK